MDKDKWLKEARRWALHAYCYEGMVDEFPEAFGDAFDRKWDPYEAVDAFADKYGLDRADQDWGINYMKKFVKEWRV